MPEDKPRRFVYYVPKLQACTAAKARELGLAYAVDAGAAVETRGVTRGPCGQGPGLLVGLGGASATQLVLDEDAQTWLGERRPGAGGAPRYWVGVSRAAPPRPQDLARATLLGTYSAELGDGNRWTVPTARAWPEGTPLPKTRAVDDQGEIARRPKPEYDALRLAADEVWDAAEHGTPVDDVREWEIAVTALSTNYRVSHTEVDLLGLLDEPGEGQTTRISGLMAIAWALIDFPSWPQDADQAQEDSEASDG